MKKTTLIVTFFKYSEAVLLCVSFFLCDSCFRDFEKWEELKFFEKQVID